VTARWLRTLGWWASDYSYVLYWQGRGAATRLDLGELRTGELGPILVIPGVYESWKFLAPLITELHGHGHPVLAIPELGLNVRPVPESAERVVSFLEANDLSDVTILAHSKGGLIGKQAMVHPRASARVRGMVAVATPFAGSVYAKYMLAPSLRIFSPKDVHLRALASEEEVNSRIVSVYGAFDPHIPARSALAGARNVELATGGHFRILAKPQVLEEVLALARH
jgi:pimeloyl-ACP methyl ester carboxylesterase